MQQIASESLEDLQGQQSALSDFLYEHKLDIPQTFALVEKALRNLQTCVGNSSLAPTPQLRDILQNLTTSKTAVSLLMESSKPLTEAVQKLIKEHDRLNKGKELTQITKKPSNNRLSHPGGALTIEQPEVVALVQQFCLMLDSRPRSATIAANIPMVNSTELNSMDLSRESDELVQAVAWYLYLNNFRLVDRNTEAMGVFESFAQDIVARSRSAHATGEDTIRVIVENIELHIALKESKQQAMQDEAARSRPTGSAAGPSGTSPSNKRQIAKAPAQAATGTPSTLSVQNSVPTSSARFATDKRSPTLTSISHVCDISLNQSIQT